MKKCKRNTRWIIVFCMLSLRVVGLLVHIYTNHKVVDLYLTRHAQTVSNTEEKLVGGGGDSPLTEEGMQMAREAGERFKTIDLTKAYCSSQGRAQKTAEIILSSSEHADIPMTVLDDLKDISWGTAEGMTAAEYMKKYDLQEFPDAFGDADDASYVSPVKGAETKYAFCKRFDGAIEQILKASADKDKVLVVAHSSMSFWLQKVFGNSVNIDIKNCESVHLRYKNGKLSYVD